MRKTLSDLLVSYAQRDERVILLTGDHGYALFDDFRKFCAKQYINAGIAEQNMVGMAAGLAKTGYFPIVYGLSAFIPIRVLEQIKLDVCHDNLPVIFLGDGAGFVYGELGTSHQSTEDIAATRAIPNLSIFSPADRFELSACFDLAMKAQAASYIRIGKADLGDVHQNQIIFGLGDVLNLMRPAAAKVAIMATGSMVKEAQTLLNRLPKDSTSLWSVPCIKPVNASLIANICNEHEIIVTLEEHSTIGGLGSLIAEIATDSYPKRIVKIGVKDCFSKKCGSYFYLRKEHSLDTESIASTVIPVLQKYLTSF